VGPQKPPQTRWFFFTAGIAKWLEKEQFSIEMRVYLNLKYPICILIFQQIHLKLKNKAQQICWALFFNG
jgi:hypothetical protein